MKLPPLAVLLALQASAFAADQVVTLGDSLTYAYEGEFCFRVTIPFTGTYGDNMPATVRNWIETLSSTTYRNASFDQGTRIPIVLDFRSIFGQKYTLLLRNRYNWAIPGLKVDEMRQFVLGEKTFLELLAADPDFAPLATALDSKYSSFNETTDFNLTEMNDQITNSAERLVFFIGGNDVRTIYGTVYNGGSAGTFVDDFIADSTAILDKVQQLKPNIQIVVVAVPHIGITPDIKTDFPTDAVKTGRVTALMQELNGRLEALAVQKGAGFADIFTPTLPMLNATPYGIHGIPVTNSGTANGNQGFLWLNGEFSANFHPNTNAQALIANEIVLAFNRRYNTGIAPLTATEMLGGLMGKTAPEIDMTFANWMTGFGLTGGTENSDADGDGLDAGMEFALGFNPILRDANLLSTSLINGGTTLELAYPRRLTSSTRYTLQAQQSPNLTTPFATLAPAPTVGTDGRLRAQIPVSPGKGFMRLNSTLAP
ncbi:SGNH/GDSL hydrolase family protein [Haloferula sp. BvORR071]|uniref:SGNH/GDSL hydrolase family protein n=1 Tax=Haloferula sp. BvORR071 TaxID=1396141 RepID=UPI00054E7438|nr:SGNH/GDSL hydrolase family protein [Haloferula sp. BvORR071]